MAQVHVRIADEEKEEWREYADREYDGRLSLLVRESVREQMREREEPESTQVDIEPLVTRMEELETKVLASMARDESEKEEYGIEIVDRYVAPFQDYTRDYDPETPDECRREARDIKRIADDLGEAPESPFGTAYDIAVLANIPESEARELLIKLERSLSEVESILENGIRRWYRRTTGPVRGELHD